MAVHKVTFLPQKVTVEVDDDKYPLADHGKPGSLLDIALAHDIELEQIIEMCKLYHSQETDEKNKLLITKVISQAQEILANEQKEAEAAMGISPGQKALMRNA